MKPRSDLSRLIHFAVRHWKIALLQFILAMAGTLLILVFPSVAGRFIDDIIPNRKIDLIIPTAGLALGAFALREFFFYLRTRVNSVFEQRMIIDLRSQLHERIMRFPLKWFDQQSTGDVLTRMADDVPATQRVILEGVEQGMTAVLQIGISAAWMIYTNPRFAAWVMIPTPLIAAGGWIFAKWVSPRSAKARVSTSQLNSLLFESISGIRLIKSFVAENVKHRDFLKSSETLRQDQTHLMNAWAIYSPLMSFLGNLGVIILLTLGAYSAIDGNISVGNLLNFMFLIGFFYEPISRLHGVNQTIVGGLASAKRVFDLFDLKDEETLDQGKILDNVQGNIIFQNIKFSYLPEKLILKSIDLIVPAKTTVAIVGATGSGKSTLFQLLNRFYEATEGNILLDGLPIHEYSKNSLRQNIGFVMQEAFLFSGSIRDNLKLGRPQATDTELWEALKMACAEDFVKRHPSGLNAEVGERGVMLSGGERQRLSIARVFLKNAPILLLDEATSAVDNQSEHLIQQAIDQLKSNRTCMVIAHRLSTVKNADIIYVMRQGEILASGKHDQLILSCSYYAELASLALV
jgi:ATP-binding cassette subfamily B protein/subfamily B ATP-binding cassette protein MsbA